MLEQNYYVPLLLWRGGLIGSAIASIQNTHINASKFYEAKRNCKEANNLFLPIVLFVFVCQKNDKLLVHCVPLAGVNFAILSGYRLFLNCGLSMHLNKSSLIMAICTKSPIQSSENCFCTLLRAKERKWIRNTDLWLCLKRTNLR